MNLFLNLLKILNVNLSAGNSALSAVLGFSVGFLPLLSPVVWLILALGLVLRVNAAYMALFWLVGELCAALLGVPISAFGEYLLSAQTLQGVWQQWYNQTFWRFLNFNHTFVMGGSVVLFIVAVPLWFVFYFLIKLYEKVVLSSRLSGFASLPIFRSLFGVGSSKKQLSFVKKWINVKGSIFLVVLMSVVAVGAYFMQTISMKNLVEETLSEQWGAAVTIGSASVSFAPIGFELKEFRVAGLKDSDKAAFSGENLTAHLNLFHIFSSRIVFDKIEFSKITFDLDQFQAPKTQQTEEKESTGASSNFGLAELPTVEGILEGGDFKSYAEAKRLQAAVAQTQENAKNFENTIPSEEQYQQHLSSLEKLKQKKLGLKSAPGAIVEAEKLKKAINEDLDKLGKSYAALEKEGDTVYSIMKVLPQASQQDWQSIDSKYLGSLNNSVNLVALLFDTKVQKWVKDAQLLYALAQPYIPYVKAWYEEYQAEKATETEERVDLLSFGRYIAFEEDDPQPDFNIRHFIAKASDDSWDIAMQNINFDHPVSQLISTGAVVFRDKGAEDKYINITIDHRDSKAVVNKLDFDSGNNGLSDRTLLANENLSMIMQSAKEHQKLEFNLQEDAKIAGFWQQDFSEIKWDQEKMQKSKGNALRPGLFNKIKDFRSRITVGGKITAPKVDFNSNLDQRLQGVLNEATEQQLKEVKQKAKERISAQSSEVLSKAQDSLAVIARQKDKIQAMRKRWDKELVKKIDSYKKEAQNKATAKVEQKLKDAKDSLLKKLKLN
jgi:uncharacterized protein (TIGR03545 family)/uncharacterized protein (TIGR03546 family)